MRFVVQDRASYSPEEYVFFLTWTKENFANKICFTRSYIKLYQTQNRIYQVGNDSREVQVKNMKVQAFNSDKIKTLEGPEDVSSEWYGVIV